MKPTPITLNPIALGHQPKDFQLTPVDIFFRPPAPKAWVLVHMLAIGFVFPAIGEMLIAGQFLLGFRFEAVKELGMQQTSRGFFTTPFVINKV